MFVKVDLLKDELWISIPNTARYLLRVLIDHCANDDYTCFPSVSCLAQETGLSKHAISNAISKLTEMKAIMVQRTILSNGGRQNFYDLSKWKRYKSKKQRSAPNELP